MKRGKNNKKLPLRKPDNRNVSYSGPSVLKGLILYRKICKLHLCKHLVIMKYTSEIIIDRPREEVINKLDNAENMQHWQRGLIKYEFTHGTPGEEGAQMALEYQMGKRNMVLTETIIKNNFPSEFHANYDAKGVHNIQRNFFHEINANSTKWVSETEFQFSGFGMKLMGFLMPGVFKKQSMKYLVDFKNFVENGDSVKDS